MMKMKARQPSYEDVWSDDNLGGALREIAKKRNAHPSWTEFSLDEGAMLEHAQLDLIWETYQPGPVTEFDITDPKPRHIIAPRLYDRLIHHALIRATLPVFEAYFHHASFACRRGRQKSIVSARTSKGESVSVELEAIRNYPILAPPREVEAIGKAILQSAHGPVSDVKVQTIPGKGTIYACIHYQRLIRKALGRWGRDFYVISIDIKSFFASIPHPVIKTLIDRLFDDKRIVGLFSKIIDAVDQGLPIGFLPSQHEANLVGTCFDYFATDILGYPLYIRYADDMRLLVHTKEEAKKALAAIDELAVGKLGLRLSEKKTHIRHWKGSDVYCGMRVHPHHMEAKAATVRRHERRTLKKERLYLAGELPLEKLDVTTKSAEAYLDLTGADSPKIRALRRRIQSYSQFCPRA